MSLSGEVRIRLDVTHGSEQARPDESGDEQPMRSRTSPEQRERIRELFETDMSVRTELATTAAGDEPLRMLPSFEVELGPDGRAYAVEPGVKFDPPEPRVVEPPPKRELEPPADAPPEHVEVAVAEEYEPPPKRELEPEPREQEPKQPEDDPPPVPAQQRFAEAYRKAAELPPIKEPSRGAT